MLPLDNQETTIRRNSQDNVGQPFFSFAELAKRWRCSRGTVYNRLRALGAEVLDFAPPSKKGRKVIALNVVLRIEQRRMKRLR
jgi:hypothetical protein